MKDAPDYTHQFRTFAKGEETRKKSGTVNAVIYTRVSTKDQADNNMSLSTQHKACTGHCVRNGWNVVAEFGGTHESAKDDDRKEFKRMMDFVKKSRIRIDNIVVYSLDRFSRSGASAMTILEDLRKRGVSTCSVTQPIDASTPSGELNQAVTMIFNKFDNDLRKQKVTAGIIERLRKGKSYGFPARGYKREYNGGKDYLLVLNEEGKLLRKAFQWKATGQWTNKQIIAKLKKHGMEIIEQQLSKIFHNPFYCGLIVNKLLEGEVIQGVHEPCISPEVFLKVNGILQDQNNHGWKVNEKNEALPLKKFMHCGCCNLGLTGYLNHAKDIHYYKCKHTECRTSKNADALNAEVQRIMAQYALDPAYQQAVMFHLESIIKQNGTEGQQQRTSMELQLAEKRKVIEDMEERHALGKIDDEVYKKYRTKYLDELTHLQSEILKIREHSSNHERYVEAFFQIAQNPHEIWARLTYEDKQILQYILFPDGMVYDKKNDAVLTPRVNEVFLRSLDVARDSGKAVKGNRRANTAKSLSAGREGFEPPVACTTTVFKTAALNRSAISPR